MKAIFQGIRDIPINICFSTKIYNIDTPKKVFDLIPKVYLHQFECKLKDSMRPYLLSYLSRATENCLKGYAVVHLWISSNGLTKVDHISLTLSNGVHISFWEMVGKLNVLPHMNKTLKEDLINEKYSPIENFLIHSSDIDENRVTDWWFNDHLKKETYEILESNCAMTVIKALRVGTMELKSCNLELHNRIHQDNYLYENPQNPQDVFKWIKKKL
jgi:hypothetical protein